MVLAGPGSGKTTVLTHRIRNLIQVEKVNAANILVITFTKAAATEMEERYLKLAKEQGAGTETPLFGTFHSVFFSILKQHLHFTHKNIITERDQHLILRELTEREKMDIDDPDFYRQLLAEISAFKSEQQSLEMFRSQLLDQETFAGIVRGYQKKLKAGRLIDFDDMIRMCYQLLRSRSELLAEWQQKYRYILVDEFQDINRMQYELVRLLAAREKNLFIVGDDDQSIYRFRGARPEIMLGFRKDYPQAEQILLGNNYRSRKEIVDYASSVIAHNKKRFRKQITAVRGTGGRVIRHTLEDTLCENVELCREIKEALEQGAEADQIAVLYRTNSIIRPLIEELNRQQIPYVLREKIQNIYEHFIAKDMLAYIRLSIGRGTRGDFLRVMNKPLRYISRDLVRSQAVDFRALMNYYADRPEMRKRVECMLQELNTLRRLPTAAALVYIRKKIGYEHYIDDFAAQNRIGTDQFHDIMNELEAAAVKHPDKAEWLTYVDRYSRMLMQEYRPEEAHGIRLMTYHASKGLEFHTVHMIDCVEGITPYKKAVSEEDVEEERREFYVACTRAKENLHIYVTNTRYSKACKPSRFVPEGEKNGKQGFFKQLIRRGADDSYSDTR